MVSPRTLALGLCVALLAAGAAADDAAARAQALAPLEGLDTEGVCDALDQAFGYDVCALVAAPSMPRSMAPTPAPASSRFTGRSGLAPSAGGGVCSSYNFDNPRNADEVVTYVRTALLDDPVQCFALYMAQCQYEYASAAGLLNAFTNWATNYQSILDFLSTPSDTLVAPDCYDVYTIEQQQKRLTGSRYSPAPTCDDLPDADETTPLRMDWNARGLVTPVTEQFGGTCYVHAAVNWLGSLALRLNLTDESGRHTLTNRTTLSVQPVLDCLEVAYTPGLPCDGGKPENVTAALAEHGTTTTRRSPYMSRTYQRQNGLTSAECWNPDSRTCATLDSNATLLYKVPDGLDLRQCQLSESQLVRYVADNGPVIVLYAAGPLGSNWRPYRDAAETVAAPWSGFQGDGNNTFCASELNHAVLLTGYSRSDPDNSYWVAKNSWGTAYGADGYFFAAMSPPSSPDFTDRDYTGACGITSNVYTYDLPPAASLSPAAAVSG